MKQPEPVNHISEKEQAWFVEHFSEELEQQSYGRLSYQAAFRILYDSLRGREGERG